VALEKYNNPYGIIRYAGELKKEAIAEWLDVVQEMITDASKSETASRKGNEDGINLKFVPARIVCSGVVLL
jgi:hypothetical protein